MTQLPGYEDALELLANLPPDMRRYCCERFLILLNTPDGRERLSYLSSLPEDNADRQLIIHRISRGLMAFLETHLAGDIIETAQGMISIDDE
jgi:hypothetical protein